MGKPEKMSALISFLSAHSDAGSDEMSRVDIIVSTEFASDEEKVVLSEDEAIIAIHEMLEEYFHDDNEYDCESLEAKAFEKALSRLNIPSVLKLRAQELAMAYIYGHSIEGLTVGETVCEKYAFYKDDITSNKYDIFGGHDAFHDIVRFAESIECDNAAGLYEKLTKKYQHASWYR